MNRKLEIVIVASVGVFIGVLIGLWVQPCAQQAQVVVKNVKVSPLMADVLDFCEKQHRTFKSFATYDFRMIDKGMNYDITCE